MNNLNNINEFINFCLTNKLIIDSTKDNIDELDRISKLDVSDFTEADVRAEIIDPIIKILGYQKGKESSVYREKNIKFADKKNRYIDYSLTLYEENFWLIEAKKPLFLYDKFRYEELSQAIEYSIHPSINAAIVMICDGIKIEIYDRETNVEEPIIKFLIKDIIENFSRLIALLSPVQIWFFYKRRILNSIDKAVQNEFNQKRVNEFNQIIQDKFSNLRSKVLKNFQNTTFDKVNICEFIKKAEIDDIVDGYFFMQQTNPSLITMINRLIEKTEGKNLFFIPHKIFPDRYREYNENYICHALYYFIRANESNLKFNWFPKVSANRPNNIIDLIQDMIKQTLYYFDDNEVIKVILLASNAYRRLFKAIQVVTSINRNINDLQHFLTRFIESEFSWEQIISSPNSFRLQNINIQTLETTDKFVRTLTNDKKEFNINLAKEKLKSIWKIEVDLLNKYKNYNNLRKELNIGELFPTESIAVNFNFLAHYALCIIDNNEEWKKYILNTHYNIVNFHANMGSLSALKILNNSKSEISKEEIIEYRINTFFFGDKEIYEKISKMYFHS